MIRFDTRESVILWPSSITLVVSLQDNERNAESKEITGITYQSASTKIFSVENFLCFLFFRYRKRIKWMYFSTQTSIMTELTELTELVEVFHNISCFESHIWKTGGSNALHWKCNVNKTMILIKLFHVTFKAFFTLTSSGEVKSDEVISDYAGIKMLVRKLINHGWNIKK